jgi:hypothetical protein
MTGFDKTATWITSRRWIQIILLLMVAAWWALWDLHGESIVSRLALHLRWMGWDMMNFAKVALLFALLLAFAAIGIACAFNPDWGMKHFGRSLMGGGELRKDWNRMQMSAVGLIFAGVALFLIYVLIFKS